MCILCAAWVCLKMFFLLWVVVNKSLKTSETEIWRFRCCRWNLFKTLCEVIFYWPESSLSASSPPPPPTRVFKACGRFSLKMPLVSSFCNSFSHLDAFSNIAAAAKSLQSCPSLCDPIDGSPPGSPVPGILQARTLEWVAISFSNAWKWKVKVKSESEVAQSCLTLSDPMDCSLPGSSIHGIFQARVLEWGAIAFSQYCRGITINIGYRELPWLAPSVRDTGCDN